MDNVAASVCLTRVDLSDGFWAFDFAPVLRQNRIPLLSDRLWGGKAYARLRVPPDYRAWGTGFAVWLLTLPMPSVKGGFKEFSGALLVLRCRS